MISYKLIHESIEFYERAGFSRIESPWMVPKSIDNVTKPIDAKSFQIKHSNECLVASGEQSFLYLYIRGYLPYGQYQTTTACFRDDHLDFMHSRYFIKNEIIKTDIVNEHELEKIINTSLGFFSNYIPCEITKTVIGYDISYKEYELGSYGIRENEYLKWIYGTGCAEPRLSNIIKLHNGIS